MTDEQKTRMPQARENDCDFDGLPVHPHYCYYLFHAGFNNLQEIEDMTEEEFVETMNNAKRSNGGPISSTLSNVGKSMAKNLKRLGLIFREA